MNQSWKPPGTTPTDRKILVHLNPPFDKEVKLVQYYEPWDNYVETVPESPDEEYYGIGKYLIRGWMELPVCD